MRNIQTGDVTFFSDSARCAACGFTVFYNTEGHDKRFWDHLAVQHKIRWVEPQFREPDPTMSVLVEADNLVTGNRQKDYGHPLDNFTDIADMWTVILRKTRGGDNFSKIQAEEVALMMDVMKVSREINTPKRDNRVDGPGYWKCLDMIVTERNRRWNGNND